MNYFLIENNYISGWCTGGDGPQPLTEMNDIPNGLTDEYGNYKYQLIDGKIILNPQPPSPAQLEAKRKRIIVEEIRKVYSVDDELALLWRGTQEEKDLHETVVTAAKKKGDDSDGLITDRTDAH